MIHPHIHACLPPGFQSAPVLLALRPFQAPPPRGLFEYPHRHATGVLICHLDYAPPDDGAPDQYGQPTHRPGDERMELVAAYANGMDIEHLLADWVREEIEDAALQAWRRQRDESRADNYPDWEAA